VTDEPEVLHGGVANAGAVVRIGAHVLRPSNPHTSSIHAILGYLRERGFDGASVPVGIDPDGRERLGFVPGDVAIPPYPAWAQADEVLASVARLIRRFHDASGGFDLAGHTWSDEMADPRGGSIVVHNDVCLENVVFRDGEAVALLDFDFAAPGRPVFDLAAFAGMCVPIDGHEGAAPLGWVSCDRPARLRVVADAYGLDAEGRSNLLRVIDARIARSGEFVRRRVEAGDLNFVKMWNDLGGQARFDGRRAWWAAQRHTFAAALA
jgi:Phosphotransferase enzyme family